MYIPEPFNENRRERIFALVDAYPFGMLITAPGGAPFVSHLPFVYEPTEGPNGSLVGHMARANPQWEHLAAGNEVLVVLQGPHAYVSPSWYSAPGVPTWNYAVVHVRGHPRIVEDEARLEALVAQLTHVHESRMPIPWQPDLGGDRRARLLGAIRGFEIEVADVAAKFKLSQNRSPEDRARVAGELRKSENQTDAAVASLMFADLGDG